MLKLILLFVGLLTLVLLVWNIGPERIYEAASQLGPVGAARPADSLHHHVRRRSVRMERSRLGPSAKDIPFWRVLAIRTAGEVVNMTTPTAYVGGEPLKAYLLTKHHVPMVEGLASVVIAKTTKTIAEVVFILMGIALAFWSVGADGSSGQTVAAALVSVGFLVLVTAAFVFVQQQGLFTWLLEFLRKIGAEDSLISKRVRRNYGRWIERS